MNKEQRIFFETYFTMLFTGAIGVAAGVFTGSILLGIGIVWLYEALAVLIGIAIYRGGEPL